MHFLTLTLTLTPKLSSPNQHLPLGYTACRYLTNVRVVWKADLAANFNASIPYTTIQTIKVRNQTKFGRVLVFGTFKRCQGYVLGN